METIEIKYGNIRGKNPIIPLLETPTFELKEDWGDNSPIILNGVETVLDDAKQYFLYDVLGFCGCGMPFEAQVFWLAQINAVVSGTKMDYMGYPGGVEFFTETAIRQGIITPEGNLTNLGKLTILFVEKHIEICPDGDDEVPGDFTPTLSIPDAAKRNSKWFLFKFMTHLALRKRAVSPTKTDTTDLYEKRGEIWARLPQPVYFWVAYQLGNLDWEEHGGSAGGWLSVKGYEVFWALVDEFGVGEIEVFDLLEKGYLFKDDDLLKVELRKRRSAFIAVRPDLNWDVIIPLPTIDVRTAIQQSFGGE